MLDARLTFEEHANYIKSKTFGKIKLLGRIRHIIDRDTAMLLYKMLIVPIFDYCDYIYYSLGAVSAENLQKLQNTALRCIIRAEPRTAIQQLHTTTQMPRLDIRRKIHVAEYMYCIMNGQCPPEIQELFTRLDDIRQRSTRSENKYLLAIPFHHLSTTGRSLRIYGAIIWNSIPDSIKLEPNKKLFKASLTAYWLNE